MATFPSTYNEPSYPITKREKFDEDIMKPLLVDDRYNKKDRNRLSLYNKHRISGSNVNVSYKFGKGCEEFQLGRLFPDDGVGLQAFRFDIRNPLAKKWYWDTDIENAHFVIAKAFCERYDIPHSTLDYYVENREACLKLVSSSRKKAKTEFLKVLYGGNIKLYNECYDDIDADISQEGYKFLKQLEKEVQYLSLVIWDKYPQFHKLKCGDKIMNKKPNPKASLMSLIFQTEERKLLLLWDAFLTHNNRILAVFIHDGGFVEKIEGEVSFPNDLLVEGSKWIKSISGYDVKFSQKEIAHEWEPRFQTNIFQIKSKAFEENHCKIVDIASYVKELPDKVIIMSRNQLKTAYEHMTCGTSELTGLPNRFIEKWMGGNENIRKYDNVDIYPNPDLCPTNIFNMWRPFYGELKKGTPYKKNQDGLDFILKHFRIMCNNDDNVGDYFIKWLCFIHQYPEIKTTTPTLISKQGAGKTTITEICRKTMGSNKVLETQKPSRDIWGDFNGLMADAYFINLDELSKKDSLEFVNVMKGLQTGKKLSINSKGVNQYEINSYHHFFITTNNEDPFPTSTDDRRNLIIKASDELIGNKAYFTQLYEYIEDEDTIRTLYDYYMSYEGLEKFNTLPIPNTDYHNDLKQLSKSPPELFLEEFTKQHLEEESVELLPIEIFELFMEWVGNNNVKYDVNSQKLGVRLKNIVVGGITVGRHTNKGDSKVFNIGVLKSHFRLDGIIKCQL